MKSNLLINILDLDNEVDIISEQIEKRRENQKMISYKKDNKNIKVFLDNKRVGSIRRVNNGYSYFTYPNNFQGEIFKTIELVKKSLSFESSTPKKPYLCVLCDGVPCHKDCEDCNK